MSTPRDVRLSLGLALVTMGTLASEVLMIRVFEVILMPHIGYAIITCAMFGFGVAGAVATLWPAPAEERLRPRLAFLAVLFAVALVLVRPALNAQPHLYRPFGAHKLLQYAVAGGSMYLIVLLPFFFSGLLLAYLFSGYPGRIRSLYFWDLVGAAVGCVIYLPFERSLGPGGLMFFAAAGAMVAAALFGGTRRWAWGAGLVALTLAAIPVLRTQGYYEFDQIQDKRGVLSARRNNVVEFSEWDPVSKIDVVDALPYSKRVQYDGGSQTSDMFPFDGDYEALRRDVLAGVRPIQGTFWHPNVMAAHYLRRDQGSEVLIIGSAAGQETKAALMFNARHVDGIELVGSVVRLGKGPYADLIGGVFNDPRVDNRVGEGRSWLHATDKLYDIIQIYSNHTTTVILSGMGASSPVYLETVEAYEQYFTHLKPGGVLQVNMHYYPRMLTTAARAWAELGFDDFARHVLVYQDTSVVDFLPTMLIKRSPWTADEVSQVDELFERVEGGHPVDMRVIDPLDPSRSFLPPAFFTGDVPDTLRARMPYNVFPLTDDRPFYNHIQRGFLAQSVRPDPATFTDRSMAYAVNHPFTIFKANDEARFPLGSYTLPVGMGAIGLLFGLLLVVLPLRYARAGRAHWPSKYLSLTYFALLGAGFIVVELVMIQLFTELIGYPLYAYTAVIFAMLASAGFGSLAAHGMDVSPLRRWGIPFVGTVCVGLLLVVARATLFDVLLAAPTWARIGASIVLLFPLGFFMGMPFPLGILWLEPYPRGAVAWAWGVNGLFTVLGGVGAGVLALQAGFRVTLVVALGLYALAGLVFRAMRATAVPEAEALHAPVPAGRGTPTAATV